MAGGVVGRELDQTPTWAVAVVCGAIILISILLEKGIHHLAQWFREKDKKAMIKALDKIKTELMILGFISLLLTFGQNYIAKICIREKYANVMLQCRKQKDYEKLNNGQGRRLLWDTITNSNSNLNLNSNHRFLADAPAGDACSSGKVQLISTNAVHQLYIFIFFLAVFHVTSRAITMALGRAKMRSWKEWEKKNAASVDSESTGPIMYRLTHQTTFVRQNAGFWMQTAVMIYIVILAVGTKLQAIIAKMTIDIQERQSVVQGIPLVNNAFQLTFFLWIWYSFGLDSCFHENMALTIARICLAIGVQFLCSYITLPLYALVSQMGSNIKMSVFDEQTSKALMNWRNQARKNKKARLGGENPAISDPEIEMQSHNPHTNNT